MVFSPSSHYLNHKCGRKTPSVLKLRTSKNRPPTARVILVARMRAMKDTPQSWRWRCLFRYNKVQIPQEIGSSVTLTSKTLRTEELATFPRSENLSREQKITIEGKQGNLILHNDRLWLSHYGVLPAHVNPKDIACCIEFCTDGKSEIHTIKVLKLFENNTSAQCLLGGHGP